MEKNKQLEHWFEKAADLKVLVCGDIMIDRYISGSVDRISPEAPVPVINHRSTEDRLGGAANVALNLQALGASPVICSAVGKDDDGKELSALLKTAGMPTDFLYSSDERRTTVKTRVIGNRQHLLRVDREDTHELTIGELKRMKTLLQKAIESEEFDLLIMQDYNKGVLSPAFIDFATRLAKAAGLYIAVDPKKFHFFNYQDVDLFKPNLREISQAFYVEPQTDKTELDMISNALRDRISNRTTLITLSADGIYIDEKGNGMIIPTRKRNIVDVSGAGDTVLCIATLFLHLGMDPEQVGLLANLAGGQVCESVGVVPVDREALLEEYMDI